MPQKPTSTDVLKILALHHQKTLPGMVKEIETCHASNIKDRLKDLRNTHVEKCNLVSIPFFVIIFQIVVFIIFVMRRDNFKFTIWPYHKRGVGDRQMDKYKLWPGKKRYIFQFIQNIER